MSGLERTGGGLVGAMVSVLGVSPDFAELLILLGVLSLPLCLALVLYFTQRDA